MDCFFRGFNALGLYEMFFKSSPMFYGFMVMGGMVGGSSLLVLVFLFAGVASPGSVRRRETRRTRVRSEVPAPLSRCALAMGNCAEGICRHDHGSAASGAVPSAKLTLKYFPIAGRAEPIRLALVVGKVRYYDHRISGHEWEEKHKKLAPFGQVPILQVGTRIISQTKAILRYVGKFSKYQGQPLYPTDPLVAAKVDELLDAFDDLWILLAPTYRITDQGQKEIARQRLFAPGCEGALMLDKLERPLQFSSNGFVVSEAKGLTIADLMYFGFLNTIRSGFIEGLGPDIFNGWEKLMAHKEKIASLAAVKEYYEDSATSNPMGLPFYEVFRQGK
eukprot:TRINITY_DN38833_c0_g1_i1.p1 TRINITY_DN38833_c0_g1~~TRINITY_DN38833_c0_g1_i1.p1  ORF type:complete len:333 (+),score=64.88 TRINITY_DN38833_c0_g1_i1:1-999(+)